MVIFSELQAKKQERERQAKQNQPISMMKEDIQTSSTNPVSEIKVDNTNQQAKSVAD